ncbi:hypothetical protein [Jiella sp. M17.18]|uniref:hypothetical protein n=1 Tax=Jiella sp. M17.18 TaxID=3234247 RepID=UPI0034DF493E
MEAGGLWGESKAQTFSLFGAEALRWTAPFVTVERSAGDPSGKGDFARLAEAMRAAGLTYPVAAKPDRGYQGWGVKRVRSDAELIAYIAALPPKAGLIVQQWVPFAGEVGIFYTRRPGAARGSICSMALTYPPHVVGDGRSTIGELVEEDVVLRANAALYRLWHATRWDRILEPGEIFALTTARSARVGAVYRDAAKHITPELERRIEAIAQDIDGFRFGRFDIRFENLGKLRRGEGFRIVELNGAGAEMLHIWDARTRLSRAYRTLWDQYRTLFEIADENRRRGFRPLSVSQMIRLQIRQERLRQSYPPSR